MGVLDGKAALVTGGSRGIGAAIVRRLAADGAVVTFTYVSSESAAAEVVNEVKTAGGQANAVRSDQADLAGIPELVKRATEPTGALDILVCNAAVAQVKAIADVTEDDYDRMMATNLKGPFFLIQQAARVLSDGGRIIAISTLNTALAGPGISLYAGSKGALEQFVKVAAREYGGRGITVNAVSPGSTDTEMFHSENPPGAAEQMVAITPLGRLGQPSDIADIIAFLAGPDSRWLTGRNLLATGGLVI
jgi:3-oxoacyl-[acyl-carrier protein] reductase